MDEGIRVVAQGRSRYDDGVLGGDTDSERRRLAAMAAVCDPTTTRVLSDLGVATGWRCLEVGAGNGSIARWLAQRVSSMPSPSAGSGPSASSGHAVSERAASGHVIATDVDVSQLTRLVSPDLTVLRHDITRDPRPDGGPFDLVHARFVLEHLPEREQVLDRLLAWLKPGGVIVVESIAEFPLDSSPHPAFRDAMRSVADVLAHTIGTDCAWARGFPGLLLRRGLVEVGAMVHLPATGGAGASAQCWALTLARLRQHILDRDPTLAETVDQTFDLLADPAFFDFAFATAIAWGTAPRAGAR
ncbi:Methyltransferase family protein [Frankia sp. AiPs1]|uniref:class I SAM-dependent methyltransferase n=1 Tax=Frankia sp. AiPa1 TaxID=573492 RepID=UPI00202AE73A|nr:class I SAM-dependent methyltransferase [Frankia sp. AiPa1]MCL9759902.1 methyltransferase domain-containing protein [Frankia sp. AiPa1]